MRHLRVRKMEGLELMENLEKYEQDRRYEIKKRTQSFSIKVYLTIFIMLAVVLATLPFNGDYTSSEKVNLIVIGSVFIVTNISLLVFCYRAKKNLEMVDWILLGVTLATYAFLVVESKNMKVLNAAIYLPMFVLFVISTFKKRHSSVLLGVHAIIIAYTIYKYPSYEVRVTYGTYVNLIIVTVILFLVTRQFIRLMNDYQEQIFNEQKNFLEKNIELTALNEEYYATQEELMYQYDEIQKLAYFDSLTGLYNRSGLDKELNSFYLSGDSGFYIVLVDILRFRDVNSVYGYDTGDQILKDVSAKLLSQPIDIKAIGRIGGDVFAVIIDGGVIISHLVKVLKECKPTLYYNNHEIKIVCYFGIIKSDKGNKDFSKDFTKAEIALVKAKDEADRYCIYDDELSYDLEHRVKIYNALEKAVKQNKIYLNYQPIYDAKTRRIYGFESLARWFDAEFGSVPPDEFISVAEKTMLIHILGKHISEEAARFALSATEAGLDGKISINVSGLELAKLDFADRFIESMKQVGADKSHIAIEITETGLIHNMKLATTNLNRLKDEGYSIYLDDFGTGYSSLSYLDQLPIDILKIDKTFVDQVLTNEKKRSMLTAMIGLASNLEIKTIAEGVETQEQYELLKEMGIDLIQGYYFSKPVDGERALGMLKDDKQLSKGQ